MARFIGIAIAATLALSSGAVASEAQVSSKPASGPATLIVAVPTTFFEYKLDFQKEDSGGFGSRHSYIGVGRTREPRPLTYETRKFAAGRWVLKLLWQQNAWGACFEDKTYLIDLKPGTVAYLGFLDPTVTLEAIQAGAVARNELTGGGGQGGGIYHDVPRPDLSGRGEKDLAAARAYWASRKLKPGTVVSLAQVEDYSFRRADDRNRLKRACN